MDNLQGYVKVLMNYDINPESSSEYYKYMLKKMVPDLEKLGLSMVEAWHTEGIATPSTFQATKQFYLLLTGTKNLELI